MTFISNFTTNFAGQSGVHPQILRLETTGTYSDITAPGFLNAAAGSGVEFSTKDMFLVNYSGGMQLFTIAESGGIYTLQVYEAGSNNFEFNAIFVSAAPGASDDNPGNQMGYPKRTLQAALDAANLIDSPVVAVICNDASIFFESIELSPNRNIYLFMPTASLNAVSGPAITLNDTGANYVFSFVFNNCNLDGGGNDFMSVNGPQSNVFVGGSIAAGNIYNEGGFVFGNVALIQSTITNAASGNMYLSIVNAIAVTLNNSGSVYGSLESIPGGRLVYGPASFLGKFLFKYEVKNESSGRTVDASDAVSIISYNNTVPGQYILPTTSEAEIAIGSEIQFIQTGLGAAQFAAGSGATIISTAGSSIETNGPAAKATAQKLSDTLWAVSGDITGSS